MTKNKSFGKKVNYLFIEILYQKPVNLQLNFYQNFFETVKKNEKLSLKRS
jgi:hypothetical protein